jgi:hypothetical protein
LLVSFDNAFRFRTDTELGIRVAGSANSRLFKEMIVNNKTVIVFMMAGVCFLSGSHVTAQTATGQTPAASNNGQAASDQDIQLLRKDIRSQKKQLIAANLSLTPTEAAKFWPVYDQYQAEYASIGDAKLALIKEYAQSWGTVTDQQALIYLRRAQDIDESVVQLRKKYAPLVSQALPGKKAATFFQLDRRIGLLLDVQLASQIPLVQSQEQ